MTYENDFPTGEPILSQSKLTEIAIKVGGLIRRVESLPRFREKVVEWNEYYSRQFEAQKDWEERRSEHEGHVRADSRLQDEEAGPPENGWVYSPLMRWQDDEGNEANLQVNGWVPPALDLENCPEVRLPLPVPSEEVELYEKYAALAAIYNSDSKGVDKIDPWKDSPDIFPDIYEGIAYTHLLLDAAQRLPEADEPHLHVWIEEIEEDLKAWATPVEASPTVDRPRAGGRPEDPQRRQKEPDESSAITTSQVAEHLANTLFEDFTLKAAAQWCRDTNIPSYSRTEWVLEFGSTPPQVPGNVRFYNLGDVVRRAIEEKTVADKAKADAEGHDLQYQTERSKKPD